MENSAEKMLETIKSIASIAKTIGTHTLTIKLYEHDGKMEEADNLRKTNLRLEDQMASMIKLYRKYQKTGVE